MIEWHNVGFIDPGVWNTAIFWRTHNDKYLADFYIEQGSPHQVPMPIAWELEPARVRLI